MAVKDSFKQRRHDATADLLVGAAEEVMTRHGFYAVTMRDVAEVAGCSPATLYQYFKNKQDLLNAILEKYTAVLVKMIDDATAAQSDPVAKLRVNVETCAGYVAQNRAVAKLFHTSVPHRAADPIASFPKVARERWENRRQLDLADIRAAQKHGRARKDFDAVELERYMRIVISGYFEEFSASETPPKPDEQQRIIWNLLSGGMGLVEQKKS